MNGYLFTPDDVAATAHCITTLLENQARWPSLGAASLAKVETHTRHNTIQHYLNWYRLMHHVDRIVTNLQPALPVSL